MAVSLKDLVQRVVDYFKNLPKGQRTRFFVLLALAIVLVVVAITMLTRKTYVALYTNMEAAEAGEVKAQLDGMGVASQVQGNTIMVDSTVVDEVRVQLASEGYPTTGISYVDVVSGSSGFGSTEADTKFYRTVQTQTNIANTLKKMSMIQDAVVLITEGNEGSYTLKRDKIESSASVFLTLKEGYTLSSAEARTIGNLVRPAVSGLKMENISITDSNANQYNIMGSETSIEDAGDRVALQQTVQNQLQQTIMDLLEPVFKSRIRASVYAELNFDEVTTESIWYETPNEPDDPTDRGLMISMEAIYEGVLGAADGGVVGVDPNGAAPQYPEVDGTGSDADLSSWSYKANYEINQTRQLVNSATGSLVGLSVSVLLDSNFPGALDAREDVRSLVANALDVSVEHVTVACLPFVDETDTVAGIIEANNLIADKMNRANLIRLIIIVAAILAFMLIVLGIVLSLRKKEEVVYAEGEMEYLPDGTPIGGMDYVADEDLLEQMNAQPSLEIMEKEDTNLSQLEEYIEKSPESVAQLLRNWLTSEDFGK